MKILIFKPLHSDIYWKIRKIWTFYKSLQYAQATFAGCSNDATCKSRLIILYNLTGTLLWNWYLNLSKWTLNLINDHFNMGLEFYKPPMYLGQIFHMMKIYFSNPLKFNFKPSSSKSTLGGPTILKLQYKIRESTLPSCHMHQRWIYDA